MPLFGKKKKTENIQVQPQQVQQQTPGDRISSVMKRMYKLIVSSDLEMDSCYVEEGELSLGEVNLQRKGKYEDFANALIQAVNQEDKEKVTKLFSRKALMQVLFEGKSSISTIASIGEDCFEIRSERIPELNPASPRIRCCVYIRPVTSRFDDGRSVLDADEGKQELIADSERVLDTFFMGSYELSLDTNVIYGYKKSENGLFIRMQTKDMLKQTVDNYIEKGYISEESAENYRDLFKKNYLSRKTLKGPYVMVVKLRRPGTETYRWYEDVFIKNGNIYRIYRRDINDYKTAQEIQFKSEEQERFERYSRTMMENLAGLVEFRNTETGPHIENVQKITEILLQDINDRSPDYNLTRSSISLIAEASIFHYIGKITIPDAILNKPGRLTKEEFEVMKTHTTNGARILDRIITPDMKELYEYSLDIALHHHERYDGNGYPEGLKGENITIGAQTVGLADAFDALVSVRCYKAAFPKKTAIEMIKSGECGVFNPRLIQSMTACFDKISELYNKE